MITKIIQQICLAAGLALILTVPAVTRAGGNEPQASKGQVVAKFTPIKSDQELNDLKPGDVILKVCRDCGCASLIRVDKPGKGVFDYVAKKCESCGSENTYLSVTKDAIPFKERPKP